MRIAIVMQQLPPRVGAAGFAIQGWRTATGLAGLGHDVTVLVPVACQANAPAEHSDVVLRFLEGVDPQLPGFDRLLVDRALDSLQGDSDEWDVVQVRGWRTAGSAGLACRQRPLPFPVVGHTSTLGFAYEWEIRPRLILTGEGSMLSRHRKAWARRRYYLCEKFAVERAVRNLAAFSTVTRHGITLARRLYGMPASRLFLVPDGVPAEDFSLPGSVPRAHRILFAGALVRRKGAHLLVQAFARILGRHPEATLRVVGDGPERGMLEVWVMRHGLQDRVSFVGSLPYTALCSEMLACTTFVNPTVSTDGYDSVQIMAMLAGCPIVSARTASNRMLVDHGRTGFLFSLGSSRSLARTLDRVLALSPAARETIGVASRARALEGFTTESMARAAERMLLAVVKRGCSVHEVE